MILRNRVVCGENDSNELLVMLCKLNEFDETQIAEPFPGRPLDTIVCAETCSLLVAVDPTRNRRFCCQLTEHLDKEGDGGKSTSPALPAPKVSGSPGTGRFSKRGRGAG